MRWIGRQIGPGQRFRVLKKLGEGPLRASYRARDQRHSSDVAVKVLDDSLARDHELIARLETEVELQAAPIHGGLVRFEGHFRRGDSLAVYRRYVEGVSLEAYLAARGQPLPLREVLALVSPVIQALATMHSAGLCHFGLRPSNVLLKSDDVVQPLLVDAGIYRILGPDGSTLDDHFAAPEIQAGEVGIDRRADIYSTGALFSLLLTGKPASGRSPELAAYTGLSVPLLALLTRAMATDPADRFHNAVELYEALRHVDHLGVTAEHYFVDKASTPSAPHETVTVRGSPQPANEVAPKGQEPPPTTLIRAAAPPEVAMPASIMRPASPRVGGSERLTPRAGAPQVADRRRTLLESWSTSAGEPIGEPDRSDRRGPLDETPLSQIAVETPQDLIEAPSTGPVLSTTSRLSLVDEIERTLTGDIEAAAEFGAVGALDDDASETGLPAPLTNEPRDGSRVEQVSEDFPRVPTLTDSRPVRASPRAYLTAPPTASLPSVPERRFPLRGLTIALIALLMVGALVTLGIRVLSPPGQATLPKYQGAPAPSPLAEMDPAVERSPTPNTPPTDLSESPEALPTQPAAAPAADPVARTESPASLIRPEVEPSDSRSATDAEHETAVRFDDGLWADGNTWVFRHRVDAAHPVDSRDYYVRRRVTASSPHPWGTRLTVVETGGDATPRTIERIASATCLIDPATERIDFCLPGRADELETRDVLGTDAPVSVAAQDEHELLFGPSLGWVAETWRDPAGNRRSMSLVGWQFGDVFGGEPDLPAPTCAWARTARTGAGIGRTDREGGLSDELAQARSWGLEGRLRRIDVPLSGRLGPQSVHAWYSRYRTAYVVTTFSEAPIDAELPPLADIDLPLDRAWVWEGGHGADLVALLFEKDGQHAVDLVSISRDGQIDTQRVIAPDTQAGGVRIALVPETTGCALHVVRSLRDGTIRFANFSLGPDGPARTGGDL